MLGPAVNDHKVGISKSGCPLAQWTCREQPSVSEALPQVLDEPAFGGVADPELHDVVREQRRNQPGEEEREPDGGPGDDRGLAEQREDAGPDHRADADEGCAADGHLTRGLPVGGRTNIIPLG